MDKTEKTKSIEAGKEIKKTSWFSEKIILQVIGVTTPFLYLFGYFYHQGYLIAFDASSDAFPQSIEYYLISCFVLAASSLVKYFSVIVTIIIGIFAIFISSAFVSYGLERLSDKIISHWKLDEKNGNKAENKALENSMALVERGTIALAMTLTLIIAFAAITYLSIYSYEKGADIAKQQKKDFSTCEMEKLEAKEKCDFLILEGKVIHRGLIFAQSDTHYGIWDGKKSYVEPINDLSLEVRHGTKVTGEESGR